MDSVLMILILLGMIIVFFLSFYIVFKSLPFYRHILKYLWVQQYVVLENHSNNTQKK